MRGDGREKFYRYLNIDKATMKLLYYFRELKTQMLKGKDEYENGKVYPDNKIEN